MQSQSRDQAEQAVLQQWRSPTGTLVHEWTGEMVAAWLELNGFERDVSLKFQNNDVDGSVLLRLSDADVRAILASQEGHAIDPKWNDLAAPLLSAKTPFADKIQVCEKVRLMQRVCKKTNTRKLQVPGWLERVKQLGNFRWADTSEAKSISGLKSEVVSANTSVAMVSTLVWAMCWDIFYSSSVDTFCLSSDPSHCYFSGGFDLSNSPLTTFYFSAGICSMLFLFSTLVAVMQMIMVNEMSDDKEVEHFLELLGDDVNLGGMLLFFGILLLACPITTFMVANHELGVYWTTDDTGSTTTTNLAFGWLTCGTTFAMATVTLVWFFPKFVEDLYLSKVKAIKKDMAELAELQPAKVTNISSPTIAFVDASLSFAT